MREGGKMSEVKKHAMSYVDVHPALMNLVHGTWKLIQESRKDQVGVLAVSYPKSEDDRPQIDIGNEFSNSDGENPDARWYCVATLEARDINERPCEVMYIIRADKHIPRDVKFDVQGDVLHVSDSVH